MIAGVLLGLTPNKGHKIFVFSRMFTAAQGPTQPPIQLVPEV
jgi:hypothetical protein